MHIDPAIEFDEDELRMGWWVKYPRVVDRASGRMLVDLSGGSWSMIDGTVAPDRSVLLVVSHMRSGARFRLEMSPDGRWAVDGEAVEARELPKALVARNVDPLIARARVLLARRPEVPDEVARGLDVRMPVAKLFRPYVRSGGAAEVEDTALYWVLYDLDEALVASAPPLGTERRS